MNDVVKDDLLERLVKRYIEMGFTEEEAAEKAKQIFYQIVAI